MTQTLLPLEAPSRTPPAGQLLKWIGNKQRFAPAIVQAFPPRFGTYYEPFIGSGAVLATLRPDRAVASDVLRPLVHLWQALQRDPQGLIQSYADRWHAAMDGDKLSIYLGIRERYNAGPNAEDLLFLSRTCYGGVIRFAKDGSMNTPCGVHRPITPEKFGRRAAEWHERVRGAEFRHSDFEAMLDEARPDDLVYCDPPYGDSESTLYGAQAFTLARLYAAIERCRGRGVHVALSIDGTKRSGGHVCPVEVPGGLFAREVRVVVGRSMLRRFQMAGQTLEGEVVADRLLCTWR